ncbi:PNK3P-domain-containing protein [Plenodomus tracheiphilus IPT5]|uniref:PNK3P-domain-containing protein n=1 Tax=Plenodomus tracheiphilus IPT5 TaxID=1408161 RepID=A0A6A7BA58_9PLEO|nr:PNK3P-domain-containing protein [Plenodomus tracheiphilus IPT5]
MNTAWDITGPEVLIGRHVHSTQGARTTYSTKIAAFDLDATLVVTKSGKFTAVESEDWDWWHASVPARLKQISEEGYDIIIVTNQGRLTMRNGTKSPIAYLFQSKIESIFHALEVPATIYAACANDIWRKPRTYAWDHYIQTILPSQAVDLSGSYFVGDAAGRPQDHTDADRHFSMNVGIRFYTPEEYFLEARSESWEHKFDPSRHYQPAPCIHATPKPPQVISLVLLVGLPGSGKTTYYQKNLQSFGYDRIGASSGTTEQQAIAMAEESLEAQKTVVVDGWNLEPSSRKLWLAIGRTHGVAVFAVHINTVPQLCLHNDAVRALGSTQEVRAVHPRLAFWDLVRSFQPPQKAEGFDCVFEIDFNWTGPPEALKTWRKFWI